MTQNVNGGNVKGWSVTADDTIDPKVLQELEHVYRTTVICGRSGIIIAVISSIWYMITNNPVVLAPLSIGIILAIIGMSIGFRTVRKYR